MAIPSFIFGGDTNETPESIKRKREIANALAKGALSNAPKDIGSGLSAIGQALIYRKMMKDADKAETGFKSEAQADADALIGGFGGTGSAKPSSASGGAYGGAIPLPGAAGEISGKPVDLSGDKQTFVDTLLPAAIEEGKRTGIDPRIIVAQAAQETGWGKSAPGNNFFGIKSHGKDGGNSLMTTEYVNGQPVKMRDSFRAYENPQDSVRGYGDFMLQNPRYKPLREAKGLDDQLSALQASGYATDPNYSRSVGAIARGIKLPTEVASLDPSAGMTAADAINAIAPAQQQSGPESAYVDPAVKVVNPVAEALAKGGNGGPAVPPAIAQALANRGQQPQQEPMQPPMPSASGAPSGQLMAGAPGNAPPLPPPQAIPPQPPIAAPQQPQGQPQAMQPQQPSQAPVDVAQAAQGDMGQSYFPAAPNAPDQSGPSMRQIMRVLQNPYSSPEVKAIAAQQLEKMQQANDPAFQQQQQLRQMQMEKTKLELEGLQNGQWTKLDNGRLYNPRTGEIKELPAAENATPSDLGLNPQYGVDEQGNPVILQLGKDGKVIKSKMPEGVALSKEPIKLDAGTHFVLLDPITRQPVGQVPKDLAGAEFEKASGKAQGEAKAAMPAVEGAANELLGSIDSLYNDPYLGNMLGPIDSRTPNLTTDAARVQSKMDQIGGQTFMQAFNSLRGGGQITEQEGAKASAAMARLNTAQSDADYKAALDELRGVVTRAVERARKAADGGAQQASPTSSQPQQGGRLRFNPETGELE